MVEVIAVATCLFLARVRDPRLLEKLHGQGAARMGSFLSHHQLGPGLVWALFVLLPAVVAGIIDALIFRSGILRLILSLAVVLLAWDIARFRYFNSRVIQALYGNDNTQVEYLVGRWLGRGGERTLSTEEVLGMCGKRLCEDLFLSMFWFGVLGPAGAVLGFAHGLAGRVVQIPEGVDRVVRFPVEMLTVLIIAIGGNFGPAMARIHTSDPVGSAIIAAAGIDPEHVHIEQVPDFRRLVDRVFWLGFLLTVILALVFR